MCDFAEVYHIYDLYGFPAVYTATLACGLGINSRIGKKLTGLKVDLEYLLLAHIADGTAINAWLNSEDGRKGTNRPRSFVTALTQKTKKANEVVGFETANDFEEERERMLNEF